MINIASLLFSSFILFSPLASSSLDNFHSSTKIYNTFTYQIARALTMAANPKENHLISYSRFPDFDIVFTGSYYNQEAAEYNIFFSIESEEILNYNAYILNSNNIEIVNTAGFINNSKKVITLKMTSTQPGTYQVIIELADNNKKIKEITHTIVIP